MKSIIFVLIILGIFLITTSEEEAQENHINTIETSETPKKPYIATPLNTYKTRIEAQNIVNTINPSSSYLGSRVDAMGSAKRSVKEANKRIEEQNKAMDALLK